MVPPGKLPQRPHPGASPGRLDQRQEFPVAPVFRDFRDQLDRIFKTQLLQLFYAAKTASKRRCRGKNARDRPRGSGNQAATASLQEAVELHFPGTAEFPQQVVEIFYQNDKRPLSSGWE